MPAPPRHSTRGTGEPEAIRRTGPPAPTAVIIESLYRFEVRLNLAPTEAWLRLYYAQLEGLHDHPTDVLGDRIAFETDEDGVPAWVAAIDTWIAVANQRHAAWWARKVEREAANPEEARRVAEEFARLREKFKDL
jgi:hypothetical protein